MLATFPPDCLVTQIDGLGCVLLPDPAGPGRRSGLDRVADDRPVALGPPCEPARLRDSWELAKTALGALEAGAIRAGGLVGVEDNLAGLLLFQGSSLVARIAARRLARSTPSR